MFINFDTQHLYGLGEDSVLSQPATIALVDIFKFLHLDVQSVTEMSLTVNQKKSNMSRKLWNGAKPIPAVEPVKADVALVFNSLQIRTFVLQLA